MPENKSVTARVYDEAQNWGNTLNHCVITVNDDGSIEDISYQMRKWRWSHTDSAGGREIYVFVPRDDS